MNIPKLRAAITATEAPGNVSVPPVRRQRNHFRFNTISALIVLLFAAASLAAQTAISEGLDAELVMLLLASALIGAAVLFVLSYWPVVIVVIAAFWAGPQLLFETDVYVASAILTVGFLLAPGVEVIAQWDKIVVLRLGKFHRVKGPGLILLVPLVDEVAGYVDTRIRVTDFSAEKSLTLDTVPVHVDALAFWMVWDPAKAVLEVQNYAEAVSLSAQTALRSSIGCHTLAQLLSERERLSGEIQKIVDAKTNPWGITIISVEFKEVLVPKELEDALSRQAQATREREARVILGSTEAEIAQSFRDAAQHYHDDPTALQLRAMNMIYESIRNKGGLVLAPASALGSMNLGTVLGTSAYAQHSAATSETASQAPTQVGPGAETAQPTTPDADPQT